MVFVLDLREWTHSWLLTIVLWPSAISSSDGLSSPHASFHVPQAKITMHQSPSLPLFPVEKYSFSVCSEYGKGQKQSRNPFARWVVFLSSFWQDRGLFYSSFFCSFALSYINSHLALSWHGSKSSAIQKFNFCRTRTRGYNLLFQDMPRVTLVGLKLFPAL